MLKDKISILVFPDINNGNNKSEFHLPRLLFEIEKQSGIKSSYISSDKLKQLSKEKNLQGQIIFVNWLDTLYLSYLNKYMAFATSFLPDSFIKLIVSIVSIKIESLFLDIIAKGGKILFYYHDLNSFSRLQIIKDIDRKIRPFIYSISSVNYFAEQSAIFCVEKELGKKNSNRICQLGSYTELHGELKDNELIRKKYGIPLNSTVITSIGTIRTNRSITDFYQLFKDHSDLFFLVAGRGNKSFKSTNVIVFDDYVNNEIFVELLSCSNYILHSGVSYLTSAAVRVAISYGIPVIAVPFGSTIDMCSGALVELKEPMSDVLTKLPKKDSKFYFELKSKAAFSDSIRTWNTAANQFTSALEILKS